MPDRTHITITRAVACEVLDWLVDDALTDEDAPVTHAVERFVRALLSAIDEAQDRDPPGAVTITIVTE